MFEQITNKHLVTFTINFKLKRVNCFSKTRIYSFIRKTVTNESLVNLVSVVRLSMPIISIILP